MRNTTFLLSALFLCALFSHTAHAWSDPILVTPDSASSKNSRVVFDNTGSLHFFFINTRNHIFPPEGWDVFHCKFSPRGERLTEDIRLDTTTSYSYCCPSPAYGADRKLHVVWSDNVTYPNHHLSGIYYARLDVDGNIERSASRIIPGETIDFGETLLFEDSHTDLNIVWLQNDSLFFAKFDTTCQIIVPKTLVFTMDPEPGSLSNLEACMDGLDQIHCTYRRYWGGWMGWNLGYSRVDNQGVAQIVYNPLTPEIPGIVCGKGHIISDGENNQHLSYLYDEYGTAIQRYRKFDQSMTTIYDTVVVEEPLSGSDVGLGDIELNGDGNIVIAFVYNYQGIDVTYKRVIYSIYGEQIMPPETITDNRDADFIDLCVNNNGMSAFTYTSPISGLPGGHIMYTYIVDELSVMNEIFSAVPSNLQLSIFPNPTNDRPTFQINYPKGGDVHVQIINPAGRIVYDYGGIFLQGKRTYTLGQPLSSGVYYVVVSNDLAEIVNPLIQLK